MLATALSLESDLLPMASARSSLIETSLAEQLARTERSSILEWMFDRLPDAQMLCDRDQRIVAVNRAAERILGTASQEIVGENLRALLHGELLPGHPLESDPRDPRSAPGGSLKLCPGNGPDRTVAIQTVPILDDANVIQGIVATIQELPQETRPANRRIVAASQPMLDLLRFVRKVAASEVTSVLLQGENGTGKDLIAEELHSQSARQSKAFLTVNCAAIPESLLESELFGYEKGAFTDARAQKRGLLELADQGTLFLDEIAEMPPTLQAKLLRAIEEQTFRRLGGLKDIHVNLRIIAASNTDLALAVDQGGFRQDLYYRLNVVQLVVPALRERRDDILPLARFFVERYNAKFKRRIGGISPEAERVMLVYNWPGNVRELRNAIERAMVFEETDCILPSSLNLALSGRHSHPPSVLSQARSFSSCESVLYEQERNLVLEALQAATGNQTRAARLLNVSRDVLRYKMKKFHLSGPRAQQSAD
jgi:PAS domain S-box-containing protein